LKKTLRLSVVGGFISSIPVCCTYNLQVANGRPFGHSAVNGECEWSKSHETDMFALTAL